MKSLSRLLALFFLLALPAFAFAAAYEAALPPELHSDPDMCAHAPCKDVLPPADSFSARKGHPSYVEGYRTANGQKTLAGYVFLSTDIVDIPAYSGKPVVTLIGMDAKGAITGARILKHSEPILLLGIPEGALTRFIDQYVGLSAGDKVEVGKRSRSPGHAGVDAISGATVTVIAENQVIMRSAFEVAKQAGIIKATPKPPAKLAEVAGEADWNSLIDEGAVQHLKVTPADVGEVDQGQPYIDLYFGYLNAPQVGRSVLGKEGWRRLMADLKPNEHALFIVANGTSSFKGSGFVRGGIFDRIQVNQDRDTYTFRDLDYVNLYGIEAAGAPQYRESGIFIVRSSSFSAAYPWSLVFLGNRIDRETGTKTFAHFEGEYWLPARHLQGGRPVVERADAPWMTAWKAKTVEIILFVALLTFAATVYALRDKLVRRARRRDKRWVSVPKYLCWAAAAGFVGAYSLAQPSITQVLTWFHALLFEWKWELFLSDPFIFIFWWFIIGTTFVWGRGLFCGWLCPFGSLSEMLHKLVSATPLRRLQFAVPERLHRRLKWIKYGIFFGLLGVSFYSMSLAEMLAEVEPFKTTFLVGLLNRAWPYTLFAAGLLGLSMFTERPFCKYLCPLGAGLAIPSTFRWFGLKRKAECGSGCHACAKGCASQAIDGSGRIDQRECLLCLDCMVMYYDDHACPPLARERKGREKAGLPLTAIGGNGYYIPIKPVPVESR